MISTRKLSGKRASSKYIEQCISLEKICMSFESVPHKPEDKTTFGKSEYILGWPKGSFGLLVKCFI